MVPTLIDTATRFAVIGESTAGLVHDLRNPLAVISGFAELMSVEEDATARAELFARIHEHIERLSQMASQTLAFARGERHLLRRKVYVYAFALAVEQRLAQEFCGTGVTPSVHASYRGPAFLDEIQLARVISNLACNAREAMKNGRGTRFVVTMEQNGNNLIIRCADDGPGVPASVREQLFQPLATAGKAEGTGLGLAMVKRVVEQHGGTATFRSHGTGAIFDLSLPVLNAEAAQSATAGA